LASKIIEIGVKLRRGWGGGSENPECLRETWNPRPGLIQSNLKPLNHWSVQTVWNNNYPTLIGTLSALITFQVAFPGVKKERAREIQRNISSVHIS
jgi:hypothetical protein